MKKIIISVILSSLLCFNAFSFGVESSVSLGDVTGVKEGISVVNTDYFNLSLGSSYNTRKYEIKSDLLDIFGYRLFPLLMLSQQKDDTSKFFGGYVQTDFTVPIVNAGNFKLAIVPGAQIEVGYDSISHSTFGNLGLSVNPIVGGKVVIADHVNIFMGYKGYFSISDYLDDKSEFKNFYRSSFDMGVRYVFNNSKARSGTAETDTSSVTVRAPRFIQEY